MKKLISISGLLLAAVIIFSSAAYAGKKPFEGVITYKITYPEADLTPEVMNMMPKVTTSMIKGNMMKTMMSMGGMGKQSTIINSEDMNSVTLLDMMGQKFAIVIPKEELMNEIGEFETSVTYTDETKEVAGLACKKAIVAAKNTATGEEMEVVAWFTEKYEVGKINIDNPLFKDIEGLLLEFEIEQKGLVMKFTATDVKKKKINDSEFEVPEGYKEVTKEELQNMFGGGM